VEVGAKVSVAIMSSIVLLNLAASLLLIARPLLWIYTNTSRSLINFPIDFLRDFVRWTSSFFGFYWYKRPKNEGAIFNSVTNRGIAGAYVIFYSESGNLKTDFTDKRGHYSIIPKPDNYKVRVESTTYIFPSKIVTTASTPYFTHVYLPGEILKVEVEKQISDLSVAMDPAKINSFFKFLIAKINHSLTFVFEKLGIILSTIGIAICGFAMFYDPTTLNVTVFAVLCIFMVISVVQKLAQKPSVLRV
jgi:hypothetical protein